MEVMIAVFIIGILATLVGPNIVKMLQNVKVNQAKSTMAAIKSGINEYYREVGSFPKELNDLIEKPSGKGSKKWDGPYVKGDEEVFTDPWNEEIIYNRPAERFGKEKGYKYYELISLGPDGEESDDDIVMGE